MNCIICMHKIKKAIARILLPRVSRWENKLWRILYQRPRRYCKCITDKEFLDHVKNNFSNKDQFK
jgi:hypothetical protein